MAGLNLPWKAVLWDKDGTLVDSFPSWIRLEKQLSMSLARQAGYDEEISTAYAARVLLNLGVDAQGRVCARSLLATGPVEEIYRAFWNSWKEALPSEPLPFDVFRKGAQTVLDKLLRDEPIRTTALPGARKALEGVAGLGLPQGVATADTFFNTQNDLKNAELSAWIGFYACGDTVLRAKPDPWSVRAFAEFAQVSPTEVVVVGDTPSDAQMAADAGAAFFAVLCGSGRGEDFPPGTFTLNTPQDLLAHFHGTVAHRS